MQQAAAAGMALAYGIKAEAADEIERLRAALTAIDEERDALREALDDARADVQYVLDELLPKHSPVLVATKLTLLREKLDQARSLSSVSREEN
jgi:hypothetical protein